MKSKKKKFTGFPSHPLHSHGFPSGLNPDQSPLLLPQTQTDIQSLELPSKHQIPGNYRSLSCLETILMNLWFFIVMLVYVSNVSVLFGMSTASIYYPTASVIFSLAGLSGWVIFVCTRPTYEVRIWSMRMDTLLFSSYLDYEPFLFRIVHTFLRVRTLSTLWVILVLDGLCRHFGFLLELKCLMRIIPLFQSLLLYSMFKYVLFFICFNILKVYQGCLLTPTYPLLLTTLCAHTIFPLMVFGLNFCCQSQGSQNPRLCPLCHRCMIKGGLEFVLCLSFPLYSLGRNLECIMYFICYVQLYNLDRMISFFMIHFLQFGVFHNPKISVNLVHLDWEIKGALSIQLDNQEKKKMMDDLFVFMRFFGCYIGMDQPLRRCFWFVSNKGKSQNISNLAQGCIKGFHFVTHTLELEYPCSGKVCYSEGKNLILSSPNVISTLSSKIIDIIFCYLHSLLLLGWNLLKLLSEYHPPMGKNCLNIYPCYEIIFIYVIGVRKRVHGLLGMCYALVLITFTIRYCYLQLWIFEWWNNIKMLPCSHFLLHMNCWFTFPCFINYCSYVNLVRNAVAGLLCADYLLLDCGHGFKLPTTLPHLMANRTLPPLVNKILTRCFYSLLYPVLFCFAEPVNPAEGFKNNLLTLCINVLPNQLQFGARPFSCLYATTVYAYSSEIVVFFYDWLNNHVIINLYPPASRYENVICSLYYFQFTKWSNDMMQTFADRNSSPHDEISLNSSWCKSLPILNAPRSLSTSLRGLDWWQELHQLNPTLKGFLPYFFHKKIFPLPIGFPTCSPNKRVRTASSNYKTPVFGEFAYLSHNPYKLKGHGFLEQSIPMLKSPFPIKRVQYFIGLLL